MSETHCWKDKGEWLQETYGDSSTEWCDYMASNQPGLTCMLPDGHDGLHVWIQDDEIVIHFRKPDDER